MKSASTLLTLEAVAILALLTTALLSDDNLNHEAETWLQTANNTEDVEGNGYYYLLGIAAGESDDPRAFGRRQLTLYRAAEAAMLQSGADRIDFSLEKPLPLPAGDYYCHNSEDGCLQRLFSHPEALEHELETHQVLLDRYHEFLQFPAFKTLTRPIYYEIFPPYEYVSRGNALAQFRAMLDIARGNRTQALDALYLNIENIRRHLIIADSLIYKLVLAAMLADDLELLANVYDSSLDKPMPAIGFLTDEERSMRRPMIREFGMHANFISYFEKGMNPFDEEVKIPKILFSLLFKPNMSTNDAFRRLHAVYKRSMLTPSAFNNAIHSGFANVEVPFSLRNSVGWTINSIATPDLYNEYVARINDIDCKIALVNAVLPLGRKQWREIIENPSNVPAVKNPYNAQESPYVDAEAEALCFNGPYMDERRHRYRCVKKYRIDPERSADLL